MDSAERIAVVASCFAGRDFPVVRRVVKYMHTTEPYSRPEEIAHSLTAALGVTAMLLGIPWLVVRAAENAGAWRVIGALAFGCGGLLMFATSTLYHAVRRPAAKAVLRRLDHSAIYLLIAGTYTPLTIGVVRGSLGWSLFVIVWALAIVGVIVKLTGAMLRIPWASTLIYVLMGWSGLVACRSPPQVCRRWQQEETRARWLSISVKATEIGGELEWCTRRRRPLALNFDRSAAFGSARAPDLQEARRR